MSGPPSGPPEPRIRQYRERDAGGVRALHDRTPTAGSPLPAGTQPLPADLDDIPCHFVAFWVVEVDGGIVGMAGLVAVGEDVPEAVLFGIARREAAVRLTRMRIAPEWQRRGIGSRLVEAILAWAREGGYGNVVLETTAGQEAAIALYRRHGFAEIARSILGEWELVWMRRAVTSDVHGRAER